MMTREGLCRWRTVSLPGDGQIWENQRVAAAKGSVCVLEEDNSVRMTWRMLLHGVTAI